MDTFAKRLKIIIEKKNISQAEAARSCGISQQSINYMINNNLHSSKLAPKIAAALGINAEWLIYGRGPYTEGMIYKIPVLLNPYMLIKFLNNDIADDTTEHIAINLDLGDYAFAYLIDPKKIAICSNWIKTCGCEYLTLTRSIIKITNKKSKMSFAIFEWRKRYINF